MGPLNNSTGVPCTLLLISVSSLLSHSSDSAAMASGTSDVTATQEPAEVAEECSGNGLNKPSGALCVQRRGRLIVQS